MKYITYGQYSVNEIFRLSEESSQKNPVFSCNVGHEILKFRVKVRGHRLTTFKNNPRCIACGLVGTVFLLQKHSRGAWASQPPHLNLYGTDSNGKMVMIHASHRIRLKNGGSNNLANLHTMCEFCEKNQD